MGIISKITELFSKSKAVTGKHEHDCAKILIVDDARENRMLLELLLKKHGFDCVSCDDGRAAVELAEQNFFDVILMDIYMNEMDGFDATRAIKSQPQNKYTPIIAVTAANSEEEKKQRIDCGMDDYISKPVDAKNLLKRINRQLKRAHQVEIAETGGSIYSIMSNDPMYRKAINIFVKSLPARIKEMQKLLKEDNLTELARKAHSIKGTGGMAGFDVYTKKAAKLEKGIKSESPDIDEISRQIEELADMVRRTRKTCKAN